MNNRGHWIILLFLTPMSSATGKTIEILDIDTQMFVYVTTVADAWLCCQILRGMGSDRARGLAFVLPHRVSRYTIPIQYASLAYDFKEYNPCLDLDDMWQGATWSAVCAHLATYDSISSVPVSIDIQAMRELLMDERVKARQRQQRSF